MFLFSLAGLGIQEDEEIRLIGNIYQEKITIMPKKNRDLYFHLKISTTETLDLEVESGGQFIRYYPIAKCYNLL